MVRRFGAVVDGGARPSQPWRAREAKLPVRCSCTSRNNRAGIFKPLDEFPVGQLAVKCLQGQIARYGHLPGVVLESHRIHSVWLFRGNSTSKGH